MNKQKFYQVKLTPEAVQYFASMGIQIQPGHPMHGTKDQLYASIIPEPCGCCAMVSLGVPTEEKLQRAGIPLDMANIIKVGEES